MTLKEAKQKFNGATVVKYLVRGENTQVIPNTVQKGFITTKCYFMETTNGQYAMVVDNYENRNAEIIE